jgi:hypothetical protein
MPIVEAIAFGMIAASGGYIFRYWYRESRQVIRRKLAKLRRSSIADIKEDELVRIVGEVKQLEHVVVSPISGTTCVYYHVIVERHTQPVVDVSHGIPFILDDGTGHVYVDAARANLTTQHLRFYPANQIDPLMDRFLTNHGISPHQKLILRIREMRIDIGATFTVMGAGVADIDPRAAQPDSYRADRATRLSFHGGKKHPLVISDDPSLR